MNNTVVTTGIGIDEILKKLNLSPDQIYTDPIIL